MNIQSIMLVLAIALTGCKRQYSFNYSKLTPSPTPWELSQFRVVTNQFGHWAWQQREGTNWMLRYGKFEAGDVKGLCVERDWLISSTIRKPSRMVTVPKDASVWGIKYP